MSDFTISGDPAGIESRAHLMRQKAAMFTSVAQGLEAITTEGWKGRAADRFREKFEVEPKRWHEAGAGFVRAAGALEAWAGELRKAQQVARECAAEHARGEQDTEAARAAYDADVARGKQEKAAFEARGGTYHLTIEPFHDPGQALRDQAAARFASTTSLLETEAHRCAGEVRAGCAGAPEKRNWLESGLAFVGGVIEGVGESLYDLGKLAWDVSPFGLAQSAIDSMIELATGELTPEELAAKEQLKLETVEGMLHALTTDPVGFGKNVGKAILDWDTWKDDPAHAIGHLIPDIVITVATMGGGAAALGAKGAEGAEVVASHADELVEGAEGAAQVGEHLDDASALSHLDDAGELAHLDEPMELLEEEKKGIGLYTGWGSDHINSFLRGTSNGLGHTIYSDAELGQLSEHMSSGLEKLPAHEGVTFRGTNVPDHIMSSLEKGSEYSDKAFLSTSRDVGTADIFRQQVQGNAMLRIEGYGGRELGDLSANGHEAEVLFDKSTRFEVLDKTWNPKGYWDIVLKQK